MYQINDNVKYTFKKSGVIENVHYDDFPDLYYSIKLSNDKIIQTTKNNLILSKKIGKEYPFDKNDIITYSKEYQTKIFDIKNDKYKIFYKDKYKYVKQSKIYKI